MPAVAPLVHVRGDVTVNWLTVDNALSSSEGEFTAEHDEYGHHRFIPLMFHGGARSDAAFIQSMLQSHDTAHEMFDGNLALEGSSPPCSLRLCLRADLEATENYELALTSGRLELFLGGKEWGRLEFESAHLTLSAGTMDLQVRLERGASDARLHLAAAGSPRFDRVLVRCERCLARGTGAARTPALWLTIERVTALADRSLPSAQVFAVDESPATPHTRPRSVSGENGKLEIPCASTVNCVDAAPRSALSLPFDHLEIDARTIRAEAELFPRFSASSKTAQASHARVTTYDLEDQHYHPLNRSVPHSIWTFRVYPRQAEDRAKASVFRLHSVNGYNNVGPSRWHELSFPGASPLGLPAEAPEVLVLRDMDLGFRSACSREEAAKRLGVDPNQSGTWPQAVLMNLKERLPSPAEIERGVWSLLCDTLASRTIVVLSMDLFNPTELDLARGRSLERTACDFLARWRRSVVAAKLMQCGGLVIRLRSAAALWIRKHEKGHDASLYFVPQWEEPDRSEFGRMSGKNAVVISALTRQLVEWLVEHPGQTLSADTLVEQAAKAIDLALRIQPTMHRDGFGARWPDQSELRARGLFHGCNFGRLAGAPPTVDVAHYEIPRLPTENSLRRWSILSEACLTVAPWSAGEAYGRVAHEIVRRGIKHVFGGLAPGRPEDAPWPVRTPIVNFGELVVADRPGIERCRELRTRLQAYERSQPIKPLSIAVFGRPGSGKSFFVQQIAKNAGFGEVEILNFNLTQFRSEADIEMALLRARNINLENRMPVVFFDEFDGPCGQTELGWLRYFISPMEDGTFAHNGQALHVGKALFVFAGGVYHNYKQFRAAARQRTPASRYNKAPDFDSRLADRIDVWSINQQGEHDEVFPIRRALVLRKLLEGRRLCGYQHRAQIADGVLNALLDPRTVFNHELRSLRMLIDASISPLGRIEQSSVPTAEQLKLFVGSGVQFRRLMEHRTIVR